MLKHLLRITVVVAILTITGITASAQPAGGGPTGGTTTGTEPPPCWPPPCIPIDGGIGFLMLGGLAFGGKMAYDHKQKKKNS